MNPQIGFVTKYVVILMIGFISCSHPPLNLEEIPAKMIENLHFLDKNSDTYVYNFIDNSQFQDTNINEIKQLSNLEASPSDLPDNVIAGSCFFVNTTYYDVFDFHNLHQDEKDREFKVKTGTVYYNFCSNTYKKCGDVGSQVVFESTTGECMNLAGKVEDFNAISLLGNKTEDGVIFYMNESPNKKSFTFWRMKCDDKMKDGEITITTNTEEIDPLQQDLIILDVTTNSCKSLYIILACSIINYYFLARILVEYKIYFCIALVIFGLLLAFLGAKLLWITIGVLLSIFFISLFIFLYLFFANLFGFYGNYILLIVVLAVGVILGICLTICFKNLVKYFFILIGAYYGYVFAIFIYNFGLNRIESYPEVSNLSY